VIDAQDVLITLATPAETESTRDRDALLVGTGGRAPTEAESTELGELAARLPFVLR